MLKFQVAWLSFDRRWIASTSPSNARTKKELPFITGGCMKTDISWKPDFFQTTTTVLCRNHRNLFHFEHGSLCSFILIFISLSWLILDEIHWYLLLHPFFSFCSLSPSHTLRQSYIVSYVQVKVYLSLWQQKPLANLVIRCGAMSTSSFLVGLTVDKGCPGCSTPREAYSRSNVTRTSTNLFLHKIEDMINGNDEDWVLDNAGRHDDHLDTQMAEGASRNVPGYWLGTDPVQGWERGRGRWYWKV